MWGTVITWVTSLFSSSWFVWAVSGVLAALLAFLWLDYQGAKEDAATYKERYSVTVSQLQAQINATLANEQKHQKIEQSLRDDIDKASAFVEESRERNKKLQKQVASLQTIRRKKENEGCPLHPAIVYVFDILRQTNATNSNSTGTVPGSP